MHYYSSTYPSYNLNLHIKTITTYSLNQSINWIKQYSTIQQKGTTQLKKLNTKKL